MNTDLFSQINWLAVLVAALAFFFLGAIWYSALFRDAWIKAVGVNMNDPNARKGIAGIMITSFVTILITSIGLALFINRIGSGGWIRGIKKGTVFVVFFFLFCYSKSLFFFF